jgi:hypothetical protein
MIISLLVKCSDVPFSQANPVKDIPSRVPKNNSKKKKMKSTMLITSQCREFYNAAGKYIHA